MSNCCTTSPWNTPDAGSLVVVPPGSQAVQIPTVADCGCNGESASGSVVGATPEQATFRYPLVKHNFTAPAPGSSGGFYSVGAAQWAIPGMSAWISPVGFVSITGVSGELVSYNNISIPQGTGVFAGAPILASAPSIASGADVAATSLDRVKGLKNNEDANLAGSAAGQLLRWNGSTWSPYAASVFIPIEPAVAFSAAITTTSSQSINLTLPSVPSPTPGAFYAMIGIEWNGMGLPSELSYSGRILQKCNSHAYVGFGDHLIRCTSSTPVLTLTGGNATMSLKVWALGYFV